MEHSVVIALKDQHFEPSGSIVEAIASGDELAGLPPGNADLISGDWLDALADGLSEHGWMTLDVASVLGRPLLAGLGSEVALLDKSDAMKKAGIGRSTDLTRDRSVRRDRIAWLHGITAPQAALFDFFETIQAGLNQRLFIGLKRFEAHYATYQAGDFYKKHLDSFQGRASRVISLVLYLNESWRPEEGGELQVFNRENDNEVCAQVVPEAGRIAVFLSEEIPHEVSPAHRTRHSVACWFRQDEVPLPL